jgi:hypothetical protein
MPRLRVLLAPEVLLVVKLSPRLELLLVLMLILVVPALLESCPLASFLAWAVGTIWPSKNSRGCIRDLASRVRCRHGNIVCIATSH